MTVSRTARSTFAAFCLSALVIGGASAQETVPPKPTNKVVATVNGDPITEIDLAAALPDLRETLMQYPPDQQMPALIKGVIDIRLMARAAEAEAVDKQEENAHLLAYVRDRTLRNAYLANKLNASVTDAAVKARYDEDIKKFVPGDEVRASHVLVKTEDEAKAIIADLDKGGDFAAIAKEKSIDPGSGAQGGDLGFFGKGMMVKEFDEAAFTIPVGTYGKAPVQSQFGWHIIKVTETRKQPTPTLEELSDEIRRTLSRELILAEIDKLRSKATIVIVPPEPAPATPAPTDGATPPAAPKP